MQFLIVQIQSILITIYSIKARNSNVKIIQTSGYSSYFLLEWNHAGIKWNQSGECIIKHLYLLTMLDVSLIFTKNTKLRPGQCNMVLIKKK